MLFFRDARVLTPAEAEAHVCRQTCPIRLNDRVVWDETFETKAGVVLHRGLISEAGTARSWEFCDKFSPRYTLGDMVIFVSGKDSKTGRACALRISKTWEGNARASAAVVHKAGQPCPQTGCR